MREALGGAKRMAGREARFVKVIVTLEGEGEGQRARLEFTRLLDRIRKAWKREGRYLLRTNLTETNGAKIWNYYLRSPRLKNLQGPQRRSSLAPHLSPARGPNRLAYLDLVSGLQPSCPIEGTITIGCGWAHPEGGVGEV